MSPKEGGLRNFWPASDSPFWDNMIPTRVFLCFVLDGWNDDIMGYLPMHIQVSLWSPTGEFGAVMEGRQVKHEDNTYTPQRQSKLSMI